MYNCSNIYQHSMTCGSGLGKHWDLPKYTLPGFQFVKLMRVLKAFRLRQAQIVKSHKNVQTYARRVTRSPTLGENAYPVENATSTLWCLRILLAENVHLDGFYW